MNHTKACGIDYKIATMLVVVAALSAVLVASAAGVVKCGICDNWRNVLR